MKENAKRWLELAADSEKTAQLACDEGRHRSSVSRAYYAYYQAAHALMLHAGLEPPDRGNWAHARMPTMFESPDSRKLLKHRAIEFKQAFMMCWFARSSADYCPNDEVGKSEAKQARRWAGMMVEASCRILNYDPRRNNRQN